MPFKNPHPLYGTWQGIKRRCNNPNTPAYKDYGGRGIKVCDRWLNSFQNFITDMGERPEEHSLDRIDNDGDYTPENCRWASRKQQQRNQRVTRIVTIDGKDFIAAELAQIAGVRTDAIIERVNRGLPYEKVVHKGKLHNLSGLELGGKANGKRQKKKTHCPKGHEYTPENTILTKEGWRRCRTCFYEKERARLAKRKAHN